MNEATRAAATVRPAELTDKNAWEALWVDYCRFYRTEIDRETTETNWKRIHDPDFPLFALVARAGDGGAILGFAHYVLHPHTWSARTLCYLEDLYVAPEARGKNVGYALISHLVAEGRKKDWKRVYWHTETGNERARRLYDRFMPADDFVRYTVNL